MPHRAPSLWVFEVIKDVCVYNNVDSDELFTPSPRTSKTAARARAIAVYIARVIGDGAPSFPQLGAIFGKDHSTLVKGDRALRYRIKRGGYSGAALNKQIQTYINQHNQRKGEIKCHTGEASDLTRDTSPPTNSTERK